MAGSKTPYGERKLVSERENKRRGLTFCQRNSGPCSEERTFPSDTRAERRLTVTEKEVKALRQDGAWWVH